MTGSLQGAVLALVLGASCPASNPAGQEKQAFVPGEVMVKFADGTPGAVSRARGGEPASDPALSSYVERLSHELGVPLRPPQATSGPELLLSVDEERLTETLAESLEADPRVENVERKLLEARYILDSPRTQFVIRFRDPSLKEEPARKRFTADLAEEVGAPLEEVGSDSDFILALDVPALTLELVKKLDARNDVDYAQTNATLRPQ